MFDLMIDISPKFHWVPSPPPYMPLRQGHGLKIFMLKFYVKVFRTSLFPNPLMDLVPVLYDDRYWSKILRGIIPTPVHDLGVKVTDLELLC